MDMNIVTDRLLNIAKRPTAHYDAGEFFDLATDALELINALSAENYLLKRQQEWISMKDRLPDNDGNYLCFDERRNIYNCEFFVATGSFGNFVEIFDKQTLAMLQTEFQENHTITHWMPLPEPPKEE